MRHVLNVSTLLYRGENVKGLKERELRVIRVDFTTSLLNFHQLNAYSFCLSFSEIIFFFGFFVILDIFTPWNDTSDFAISGPSNFCANSGKHT